MTLQYTGGLDQLTKLPRNSLIREKNFLLIVTKFGNLALFWKYVTLITRNLFVVVSSLIGSPPLERQISYSLNNHSSHTA